MPKRATKKAELRGDHRWRILRIRATPALYLGDVYAPDETTALEKAAEEFKVPAQLRNRLIAERMD
jgi:hypothetical protein